MICFVDTETTGLNLQVHVPWEVALVFGDVESATGSSTYHMMIELSDEDCEMADDFGLAVGRFHERHPQGNNSGSANERLWTSEEASALIASLTHEVCLVGAVPSFDELRLRMMLTRNGCVPSWHYRPIDVETMAVGYLLGLHKSGLTITQAQYEAVMARPWKSDDVSRALGVDPDKFAKHTALGDALWAAAIYQAIMQ